MAANLKSSGELREFLVNMMLGVKSGDLDEGKARGIVKIAAQIHESFYSEIKIAKVRAEAGLVAHDLGDLPINK